MRPLVSIAAFALFLTVPLCAQRGGGHAGGFGGARGMSGAHMGGGHFSGGMRSGLSGSFAIASSAASSDLAISSQIASVPFVAIRDWIPHHGVELITTFDDVAISSPTASARSAVTTTLGLVGGAIEEIGVGAGDGATTIPGCGVRGTTMITGSIATTIASAPSPSSGTNNN